MNKKRLFLCLLMAILVPSAMFGQDELTVFEGTATSREAPMYVYYFDDYTRAQTVFPATELEDLVGAEITAIKFYTTSSNIPYTTVSSFDIYLTEVEGTSISSFVDRSDATTVYSGTNEFVATSNGGEITITFSTPYIYQGGNLLFGCDNTTDSGWKEINFYGQSKTGASISGSNSSASGTISPTQRNFIPKTTFYYTPSCPMPRDLVVTLNDSDATLATIDWTEFGEATNWILQIATNATFTEGLQEYEVSNNPTKDLTDLVPETRYYARVKADCGGEEESHWSNVINFRPSNTIPLTLNEGTATNEYVPVYGYYVDEYQKSEFIIPASTEGLVVMTDGTINQMTFYLSQPASESWGNAQFQVFMKEVPATGFSLDNYGNLFYGTSDATIVYEGPLDGTQSIMMIDFTTNYHYNGGNLLVGVYETTKGSYKRAYFAGSPSTAGSLRNNNSSSLGSMTTGEIEDFLPETTFNYLPSNTPRPSNLQANNISASSALLSWMAAADNVTSYQYQYKESTGDWTVLESTANNSVSIDGLTELTSYTFQVKAIYNEGESDFASIVFTTKQIPVVVDLEHSFEDGFEGEQCDWILLNGDLTNAWTWGMAANNGGVHALYISNDEGASNAYTTSGAKALVYAVKSFSLEQGLHIFTYDWRANGESTYDYLRVALIPDAVELTPADFLPSGFGTSQLPESWIALDEGTKLNLSTEWNSLLIEATIPVAGEYKMAFIWCNDGGSGSNPPAAVDNISISKVSCQAPMDFNYSNLTPFTATLGWSANGSETSWEIEYRVEGENEWQVLTVYENPYILDGLDELTTYEARVRAICEGNAVTLPITFTTKQIPVVVDSDHPFSDGFECEQCEWDLVNGNLANAWTFGNAINNGGEKALYISNDEGTSNAYTTNSSAVVYAVKSFTLEQGVYSFSYDWKANGESTYDYLRVALVSDNIMLTAGASVPSDFGPTSLPTDWIAIDGGNKLNNSTSWVTYSEVVNITTAGDYKVVFAWRNDHVSGSQPPAAIDNFSINMSQSASPTDLQASSITFNSAQISWTNGGSEQAWEIYVSLTNDAPAYHTTGMPIAGNPYSLTGLQAETTYYVWVRANYGYDGLSGWCTEPASFTTIPQTTIVITEENGYTDDFEDSLNWSLINGNCTNAWAWGSATNNSGEKALYISNDGGYTNGYDITETTIVFASILFTLEQKTYQFSYDWNANGENNYDYLRVALVPANTTLSAGTSVPSNFGSTTLPTSWIALDGRSQLNKSTGWVSYSEVVDITTAGDYKVVFAWRNDHNSGTQPPAAIDNFSVSVSHCASPTNLQVDNVTINSTQLNWTNGGLEEAWEIYVSNSNTTPSYQTMGTSITEKPFTLLGLNEETTYHVWIRANYGNEGLSGWCATPASFTTIPQTPVSITEENGYTDDFEDSLNWSLINGDLTNAWAWGTATNNGGDKALYVSNDGGVTNAYTNNSTSVVYTTKLFALTKGSYEFSYDWIANGENANSDGTHFDYLRVVLVPSNTLLTAGTSLPSGLSYNTVPSGWISLDGGSQLDLSTEWITKTVTPIDIPTSGDYKVVFVWRNDGSTGNNPPAAIDNFSITKLPCTLPADFTFLVTSTTAELSWIELGYATQWNLQWRAMGEPEWNAVSDLDESSYSFTDLTPNTTYEFQVQPNCTDEYWSNLHTFTTRCESYGVTPQTTFMEGFENDVFPPDCWESLHTYTRSWSRSTNVKHTGSASAYSGWYGPIYLNMPVINISQEAMYAELSFWSIVRDVNYYTGGTSGNHDGLSIVKVSTDYGKTWTQLWCPTIEELPSGETWEKISLNLTDYKDQDILITFEYQGNNAHGWYVDDVAITVYNKAFVGGSAEDATSWFNAGNWQPEGVPTLEQNVYIAAPAIIAESSNVAQANRIDFAEQGSLTIADGGQLMTNNETTATVKKNIVGYGGNEGGYYLIANPLANTISPVNAGLITTGSNYDLYDWDYSASDGLEWRNYKENNFNLYNGWGALYANQANVELSFNGVVRANNTPVTKTPSCYNGYDFSGWSLYGNPFVCDAYLSTEAAGMAFYRMNATGDGFETASGAIHPMEGFFVQTPTSGQSLTISREAPVRSGQLNMNLSRNNKRLDNAIVVFGEGRNLGKLSFRENSSKVYMPMEDKDCAAVFTTGMGEISVNFKAEENGSYTLDFSNEKVIFDYLHFIDNMTGNDVNLLEIPFYTFDATTTDYASRFKLVFATGSSIDGESFGFFNSSGNFCIFGIEGEATLQVIDMLGHVLSSEQFSGSYEKKLNVVPGVYMLRLINGNDVKVQKIVVR